MSSKGLADFYIDITKKSPEYIEIERTFGEIRDLMDKTSNNVLSPEQLVFVRKYRVYSTPLSEVQISSHTNRFSGSNMSTNLGRSNELFCRDSYLVSRLLDSVADRSTVLNIDEIIIPNFWVLRGIFDLYRFNKNLRRTLSLMFSKDPSLMIIWPLDIFEKSPNKSAGIGSKDCYKFWRDIEDLKTNFPEVYEFLVTSYNRILPKMFNLIKKLMEVSNVVCTSNKKKLVKQYYDSSK